MVQNAWYFRENSGPRTRCISAIIGVTYAINTSRESEHRIDIRNVSFMGKARARRVGCITNGPTQLHYVRPPPVNEEPCRPTVTAPVICSSCEADVGQIPLPSTCTFAISFKYWTLPNSECAACDKREPVRIFDCTETVSVAQAFEMLARSSLQCAYNIGGFVDELNSAAYYESAEMLRRVASHINKLYKKVHVIKRPKVVIADMAEELRRLDVDPTINGKAMVLFQCKNGGLKITCNQVILGHR